MNLEAFAAADNAIKKIVKDYKPVADLSAALDEVKKVLGEVGELNAARAKAQADLTKVKAEVSVAEGKLRDVQNQVGQAQGTLEKVKAALITIKDSTRF